MEKSQPVVSGLNSLHRHPLPAGKPPANLTRRKKTPCFSPKRRTRRVEEPALRPREGQRLSEINRNRNRREKGLPRGKPALLLRAAERRGLFSLARPGGNPTLSQRGALLLFPASPRSSARGHELCLGFLSSRGICRVGGGGGCGALIHPKSSRRSKVKLWAALPPRGRQKRVVRARSPGSRACSRAAEPCRHPMLLPAFEVSTILGSGCISEAPMELGCDRGARTDIQHPKGPKACIRS